MRKSLTRNDRITSGKDFERIFSNARVMNVRGMKMLFCINTLGNTRIGIIASSKYGNAVSRNKIRRQIKDIFRNGKNLLAAGYDIVFIPYSGNFCFQDRKLQINSLFEKASLYR